MKREILASTAQKRGISLDPRTKLALLVSIAVFVLGGSYAGAMQWVMIALSAVPLLKKRSHLPVVVDPSHATGIPWMVEPMTLAAIAAGADGVMIEVHNDPPHALCDGAQSLRPEQFDALMGKVKKTAQFFKTLD